MHAGFLLLPPAGTIPPCGAQASHCREFCCGIQALGKGPSVAVAHQLGALRHVDSSGSGI